MREILFRGKRLDNSEWVEGDLTRYSEHMSYITVDLIENKVFQVSTASVGQFTGLLDKYGKKIFEGDVVRNGYTCRYANGNSSDFYYNGTVFMDETNGCWAIKNSESDAPKRLTVKMVTERSIEVVGNIHDVQEAAL